MHPDSGESNHGDPSTPFNRLYQAMSTPILVVDDSAAERLFVGRFFLQYPEYSVTFANDGAQALQAVELHQPALILSDLRMPVMNGLELVKELKSSEFNIPVILITSFGSEQIAVDALLAGAASYVARRNLESDLINTIKNVLAVTERRRNRRRTMEYLTSSDSQFVLGNNASDVTHLISHLLDTATSMKLLSGQQRIQVGIALQEALSNAIHHGNLELDSELRQIDERNYYSLADQRRRLQPYASRKVHVDARLSRSKLSFVIADEGPGFDVSRVLDPTADVNLDRIGGRGLLLIRNFMDDVSYNESGNQITLVKHVSEVQDHEDAWRESSPCEELQEVVACN